MIRKDVFAAIAILFLIALTDSTSTAQCGAFFRRASTWAFPVARVHLDYATDMTGDGLPDLLASEQGDAGLFTRAKFFILPNLGNGNFGPPWATIEPPASIVFNDYYAVVNVNGDNRPDLQIMLTSSSIPTSFMTFINNGNGTFTQGPTISLGSTVGLLDVNGDGFGDYRSSNNQISQFRYHFGNGDGTFGPLVSILDHGGLPPAGEFNGDGKIDFVDANHLHLNNGDGTWGTTDIAPALAGGSIWAIADFNVDGKLDLMTGSTAGPNGFGILASTGTGFVRTNHAITADPSLIGPIWVSNWDGNSAPDILFQPQTVNKKLILTNDGTGNFPTQQVHNGRVDVMGFGRTVMADFDNDGKLDRVQGTSYTLNSTIMLRDLTSFTYSKQVCNQPGQTRVVDFDRSNTTDWSFWNPATGDWSSRTNGWQLGQPTTDETVNWGLGSLGDIPTPGDFDGDGVTDRAVFRNSTGVWYIRRSSDLNWYVLPFGLTGDKPVPGDYDGDTISDIAVWRPSDGNWYIWYMGTQTFAIVHFGLNGDKPAPADYDGDFINDIAVYRPSTGVWYYLNSSNGSFFAGQWGIDTDQPMPADFDGDGKADLTVFRQSNQFAYILRSANSTVTYYQVGVAGDIPQIADYNGDFVADVGVYRPSNKFWWTSASEFTTFGVGGAIPTSSLIRTE